MSTILKWAGNKTAIMSELKKHLPAGPRLVEPFAGSCAVMMETDYPSYLVADINPDLINLYKKVAADCEAFISRARALFEEANREVAYYNIRQEFNYSTEITDFMKAIYFLYLNRHGYRGLCRYNKSGYFNIPYGNYKNPYFPEKEIRAFAEKAQRATFICASFDETLAMLKAGDVVYCDPPYDGTFSGYHTDGFTEDDQYHLASVLEHRSRQSSDYLVGMFAAFRKAMHKAGLRWYGVRVAEPHHDGTVHWHLLCFMRKKDRRAITALLRKFAIREDREELGNNTGPRFKSELIKLHLFVDNGSLVATGASSMSWEYRYTLNAVIEDFSGDQNLLMAPVLLWLRDNQPDAINNPALREKLFTFEVDILRNDVCDISLNLQLTERVLVSTDGSVSSVEAVAEPDEPEEMWTVKRG